MQSSFKLISPKKLHNYNYLAQAPRVDGWRRLENKKGADLLPKMSALVSVKFIPVAKMHFHLFGNPAILNLRIRGFASPDYSGFALSEYFPIELNRYGQSLRKDKIKCKHF
jgi:hypothetical protein